MTGVTSYLSLTIYVAALSGLTYTDAKKYLLPDWMIIVVGLSGIAFHFANSWKLITLYELFFSGACLLVIFGLFRLYTIWLNKNNLAFGAGDVKLLAVSGLTLGTSGFFLVFPFGVITAQIYTFIRWKVRNKKKGKNKIYRNSLIPLGVGLAPVTAILFIWQFIFPDYFPEYLRTTNHLITGFFQGHM